MNKSTGILSAEQRRFLDDLATLLAGWNMPAAAARLYGYLLINNDPASLDDISAALEISKSNASGAAKLLEQYGHCRKFGEPGTKRIFYAVRDDHGSPFRVRVRLLESLQHLMESRATLVSRGRGTARMKEVADFCDKMGAAMTEVIETHNRKVLSRK
jgi:DNA-binding transcriptional regulator GbsR (MarR family)